MRKILKALMPRGEWKDLYHRHKPYDYAANVTIHALHKYIDRRRDDVGNICIVGVHNGYEVKLTTLQNFRI